MPRVSVIVPVYNVERYLSRCLDSLSAQTLEDIEFLCVNDGSTDGSLELLRKAEREDRRFRVIDKPNAGYGNTINRGILEARGMYVGIVEPDDFVEPDMFSQLLACAEEGSLDVVRANYWLYWSAPSERNELVDLCREDLCGKVFDPRMLTDPFFFPPALWSMLVRRDLILRNDLRLLETPGASFQDTSFSFKIWSCARRAALLHSPVLHYRQDNEGSSINNRSKAYFVCDEYAEVERFVSEGLGDMSLMPLAQKRKYDAYVWNLGRIDSALRGEFAHRASAEFQEALMQGWVDLALFSRQERRSLEVLMRSPDTFVARLDEGLPTSRPAALSRAIGRLRGRR